MPEEKKPAEGTEQPQEAEKPEGDKSPSEEEKDAEKSAEAAQDDNAPAPEPVPEQTESKTQAQTESGADIDALKEENFALRAQLEAIKTGFLPDILDDAVVLAENIVRHDGGDISDALKAVAKKYPEWTAAAQNEKKSGFKVGADSSGGTNTDDERLNAIFGIKKKTGGKN